jgi:hypothetical protein
VRNLETRRIAKTNDERAAMAARRGWEIRVDAPELLDRWRYALPFCLRGRQELAFGAVSGRHQGLRFTVFDYYRQEAVKVVRDAWSDLAVPEAGSERINTIWAIQLPVPVPWFQIVESVDPAYDVTGLPKPITADPTFDRWYRLVNTDPQVAAQVLHPELAAFMRRTRLHTWALIEEHLIFTTYPIFGRTKPDELLLTLDELVAMTSLLPLPILERYR